MSEVAQLDRRTLLKSLMLSGAAALGGSLYAAPVSGVVGLPLASRKPGEMDVHHIDTGRGNCTLVIAPDETSVMIDAGASSGPVNTSSEARPNASRRAGEWQGRYAMRYASAASLDYFVTTHIHPDHIGDVNDSTPMSAVGDFRLTGVSDVDALMPITTVIDRAYPDYQAAPAPDGAFARNYIAYLKHRVDTGRNVLAAMVGSDSQIKAGDPRFSVRVLSANGKVWKTPAPVVPANAEKLTENDCSVALRFTYGRFSYFAGGDLNFDTHDGREPQLDVESPVARAAGRTEVAAADHHGYFDACGPEFVRALDAQVYIVQAWDIGHPGSAQMQRMLGQWTGDKATHDVFATDLLPANALMNRRFAPQLKSRRGHVVVRVAKGGDTYEIFVVDSGNEDGIVTGAFGPYVCRT